MFTINIYLKFALIALFLGGGIITTITYGFVWSWPLLLIGILLLVSYLMLGTIQSSAQMIQEMDFDGAEKRLGLTLTPKLLYVTNRAFYYIMKGSIAMQKKETKKAEELFDTALNMKLPSDNERAMVLLQLANANATRNNWTKAKNYYREAKKLDITQSDMKMQLDHFEKVLKNQGQMKAAKRMGKQGHQMMRGPGSNKRRRPKMR